MTIIRNICMEIFQEKDGVNGGVRKSISQFLYYIIKLTEKQGNFYAKMMWKNKWTWLLDSCGNSFLPVNAFWESRCSGVWYLWNRNFHLNLGDEVPREKHPEMSLDPKVWPGPQSLWLPNMWLGMWWIFCVIWRILWWYTRGRSRICWNLPG